MNRPFIPPSDLKRIFDPSPWSNPASYRPANDDRPDIAQRQRDNLARFYRANPQFGPGAHDEPKLSEAWFYVLGAVSALLWIGVFLVARHYGFHELLARIGGAL